MKCLLAGVQKRKCTNDGMEYRDNKGRTAFHLACINGHYDIAKLLVNDGKANPMVRAIITSHFICYCVCILFFAFMIINSINYLS